MNYSFKHYFVLFSGLFLLNFVTLEPLYHEIFEHELNSVECEICKNDASSVIEKSYFSLKEFSSNFKLKDRIQELLISINTSSYFSRAPPKN